MAWKGPILISWRQRVRTRGVKILLLIVSAIISGVLCFWNGFRPQTRHSFPHSMALQNIPCFDKLSLDSSLGTVTIPQKILPSPIEIRDISFPKCPEVCGVQIFSDAVCSGDFFPEHKVAATLSQFVFVVVQRPNSGLDRFIAWNPRSYRDTQATMFAYNTSERVSGSSYRPLTTKHTTNKRDGNPILIIKTNETH